MRPKPRPVGWWKTKFKPLLYRNADALSAESFVDYILEFENRSNRRVERFEKMHKSDAQEAFDFLRHYSQRAEKNGRPKDIAIVYDFATACWRGFKTNPPDASLNVKRLTLRHKQGDGGHREKLGDIEPGSKESVLQEICDRYDCDLDRAVTVLGTCKKNGILLYHKSSNTWRGFRARMPVPADTVEVDPTLRQDHYRERYGKMPPLFHDYLKPDESPRLKWIAELDSCSIADAKKTSDRIWNVSKDPAKLAWKHEGKGIAVGVDYKPPFVITDDMRAAMRALPQGQGNQKGDKILAQIMTKLGITPPQMRELVGATRGVEWSKRGDEFAGADHWAKVDAQKAEPVAPAPKTQPAVTETTPPAKSQSDEAFETFRNGRFAKKAA